MADVHDAKPLFIENAFKKRKPLRGKKGQIYDYTYFYTFHHSVHHIYLPHFILKRLHGLYVCFRLFPFSHSLSIYVY